MLLTRHNHQEAPEGTGGRVVQILDGPALTTEVEAATRLAWEQWLDLLEKGLCEAPSTGR